LASRGASLAVFFVSTLVLSSLSIFNVPGRVAAQSPSAGQDVLLDPTRPIIYWAGAAGNDLKFINSSTGEIIASVVVGDGPSSICLSSDGTTFYVAVPSSKCIVVVDASSHSITGNISLSFYPLSVRLDGKGFMYVSGASDNAGWIYSLDMHTRKVKNSVDAGMGANQAIEVSPDGSTLLALEMGFSPVKIYKYGISAGVFTYLDVDNHNLGSYLENEVVDWARDKIYLASGAPYGIEVVSISTLDNLGMYPMDAYPSCVAMSSDGRYIYGSHDNFYQSALWMFNATDGSLMGKMILGAEIGHLAIAHDLRSAYVGLPIERIPLIPVIEHLYPTPDSVLGYTPEYFVMRLAGGMPHHEGQNATAYVDAIPLSLYPFDILGNWTYYRANLSEVLPEGNHDFSVALPWTDQIVWGNATFIIDRDSPQALRPALYPETPHDGSIQLVEPLMISARIAYTSLDLVADGGWIVVDGENMTTAFAFEYLSTNYSLPPSLGWHNVSAYIYWDGGLGNAWANWSFLVMQGPLLTPIYPARDQVLTQIPDHIEVAIDYRDAAGNASAPQLYLDTRPIQTVITQNSTMSGVIGSTIKGGNHTVRATLDWAAGKAVLTWWFELDVFVGPTGEVLVRHQYKDEFSLLVPNGTRWSLEEDSELSGEVFPLVMYGPTYGNFRTNVIVSSGRDRSVEESEAYLEEQLNQAIDELEQSGMTVGIVVYPDVRTIDNHTAYVAVIELEGYGVYQGIAIIASEAHQSIWVIIFSVSEAYYSVYSDMFYRMVDSFSIEIDPASAWDDLGQAAVGIGIAALAGGLAGTVVWLFRKRRTPSAPK